MGPSPALLMRHRIMRNRWMTIGLLVVAGRALVALAAPWLAPRDPYDGQLVGSLREPSPAYLFGTDAQGRDVLSRVLFGARLSLAVGVTSQVIALAAGLTLGLAAGYRGRWVDAVVMRAAAATLGVGGAIMAEAALSFVGLGAQPPTPSWGAMVAEGRDLLRVAPWVSLFPGLAIGLTVLGVNLVGDGLRDALDVRA